MGQQDDADKHRAKNCNTATKTPLSSPQRHLVGAVGTSSVACRSDTSAARHSGLPTGSSVSTPGSNNGCPGRVPRAVGANVIRSVSTGKVPSFPCESSGHSPMHHRHRHGLGAVLGSGARSGEGSPSGSGSGSLSRPGPGGSVGGSSVGRGGSGTGVVRRHDLGERAVPMGGSTATAAREEDRLMASIARLDALLREDRGQDAGAPRASRRVLPSPNPSAGGEDVVQRKRKTSKRDGEREIKPQRAGRIGKSRVRGGGGKETKTFGSAGPPPTAPSGGFDSIPSAVASTTATPSIPPNAPVVFPLLRSRRAPFSDDGRERGRSGVLDAHGEGGGAEAFHGDGEKARENARLREEVPALSSAPSGVSVARLAVPANSPPPEFYYDYERHVGSRDHSAIRDYYRPREADRPALAPALRIPKNDRYGGDGRYAAPRYPLEREADGWMDPAPPTPLQYRDVGRDEHRGELMRYYGDGGDEFDEQGRWYGSGYHRHRRVAAVERRDLWERQVDCGDWAEEAEQPRAVRERAGPTNWDRCDMLHTMHSKT